MNAMSLARYAQLAQAAGIVPIVEPEVIFEGDHSLQKAEQVTTRTLQILFQTLMEYKVDLSGLILKSSMVLAGSKNGEESTPEQVAQATLRTFHMSVPHDVAGIVFLSGGQTPRWVHNHGQSRIRSPVLSKNLCCSPGAASQRM
jgi:fructose-bisphosphate aldolase class I